jgi:uncharacterized protein YecT (DUF1311 family)
MPRNRVAELLTIKQRAGKYKRIPSHHELNELKRTWETKLKYISPVDELIPVKIVTMLEMFLRSWLERLIDLGAPYVERASKLNLNLKYDFAIAHSLQGGAVTFGELFAHSVSLSDLSSICSTFAQILDKDLFEAIGNQRDHGEVKRNGEGVPPIIQDVGSLRKSIGRLLEVRNILVHEVPAHKPYEIEDISAFLDNAKTFMHASEEHFAFLVYGDWPVTQGEMNRKSAQERAAATEELEALCNTISQNTKSNEIYDVQILWSAFMEAEAERHAQRHLGGTIRPTLYALAAATITKARIKELRQELENPGD